MTGRLNAVDLDSDLLFVLLDRRAMPVDELVEHLNEIDTAPFVFDDVDTDPERLGDLLAFFGNLGYLDWSGDRDDEIVLTETGEYMAEPLVEELTSEQRAAVDAAMRQHEVVA